MEHELIDALGSVPGALSNDVPFVHHWGGLPRSDWGAVSEEIDSQIPATGHVIADSGLPESEYLLPPPNPQLDRETETFGTEAIAKYLSFHIDHARWGIYIDEDRLERFAARTFGSMAGPSDVEKLLLAWRFVVDHELFHYWTDVACAQMEFAAGRAVYVPYLQRHPSLSSTVAQKEEALANARAWRRLSSAPARACAAVFMARQPQGYRDWARFRSRRAFSDGKRDLGLCAHATPIFHWSFAPFEWFFDERRASTGATTVPLRWIRPPGRRGRPYLVTHARPLAIEQTPKFDDRLSKLPPNIQQKWHNKIRPALESGKWGGTDFKKVGREQDLYRCRVGLHYRVHFRRVGSDRYEAIEIFSREQK